VLTEGNDQFTPPLFDALALSLVPKTERGFARLEGLFNEDATSPAFLVKAAASPLFNPTL
jgi:hypothetical protein